MSSMESRFCPWWLDLERNHVPEEELDLYCQHKSILDLCSQQIDHDKAMQDKDLSYLTLRRHSRQLRLMSPTKFVYQEDVSLNYISRGCISKL